MDRAQAQPGIVLAALEPRGDKRIPQAVHDPTIGVDRQPPFHRGVKVVVLRREMEERGVAVAGGLDQFDVGGGKEPDRTAFLRL